MEPRGKQASSTPPTIAAFTSTDVGHSQAKRLPMARPGLGSKGERISLLTNHFLVQLVKTEDHFFHYSVSTSYEDGKPVDAKGVGRRILDKVHETYASSELAGKSFAYDGEKSLFTIGSFPHNKLEFTVVLADLAASYRDASGGSSEGNASSSDRESKRSRGLGRSKTYKVVISYAARIPIESIANAIRGRESANFQEAVRVLDVILRQHASKQNCLLVRQSFFHNQPNNFADLGGGVLGCRGFHSSFRATQGGLTLNIDVSTTMILKPGFVIDFLLENQNVRHPNQIDWVKAKRMLKNLRIKTTYSGLEHKITGFSEKKCKDQTFLLKQRNGDDAVTQTVELTVEEYFVHYRKFPLKYSGDYPCINVGKPNRPNFIPIEFCELVSLQRYTKALSNRQRATLVEQSRQKPQERMTTLTNALRAGNYNDNPLLRCCGITIDNQFTPVEGRVLPAPMLKVGNGEEFCPQNGKWNFNNRTLVQPATIDCWAVVNFSARCNVRQLCGDLVRCGKMKGINISPPFDKYEEDPRFSRAPANVRVDEMFRTLMTKLPDLPKFLLCILPEKKISDIYGPWKRRNLSEEGIVTQCIAPSKINDQYLTNVLLKINAKMGGINSLLSVEHYRSMPSISTVPTIIVGMDVSHGSPGRDVPSIAAVVSSRGWPQFSRYRAVVQTQSPKTEMIESLCKKGPGPKVDEGIFRELLEDFYRSSNHIKPQQIIIFRDGVSESQFDQVLNNELNQIKEACQILDENWNPKFTVIVAQKNHHTKLFRRGMRNSADNVPPGTVIDNQICHPRNNDFYMCAHAGMIGTTRPTHYHVLYDDIHFSADQLQELVHSLSYVYQRSTTAISVVAPICYAHHAASQMSQFIKFDELPEASSSQAGGSPVPQLPQLKENVRNTMFFCLYNLESRKKSADD